MTADPSLTALLDPARGHLQALAALVVDHALATPIDELLPSPALAARVRAALEEAADRPDLRAAVREGVAMARDRARRDERPLRSLLLPGAEPLLREALELRWSPSEALVLRVINQPAFRELVSSVLSEALHGFLDKLKSADRGLLGGLGERAVRRGSGLFGAIAGGIGDAVGAVRDEIGSAMENKAKEFVGVATEQAVKGVAAWLAAPDHAERLATMRTGILEVVLALTLRELASEVEELDSDTITERVIAALRDLARDPATEAGLQNAAQEALGLLPDRSLGALAARYTLDRPLRELLAAWLEPQLQAFLGTQPFADWWRAVHSEVSS